MAEGQYCRVLVACATSLLNTVLSVGDVDQTQCEPHNELPSHRLPRPFRTNTPQIEAEESASATSLRRSPRPCGSTFRGVQSQSERLKPAQ